MRKQFSPACTAAKHGVKTRLARECTCGDQRVGMFLSGGGHASFPMPPDAEALAAVTAMMELAKKTLKK